MNRHPGAPVEIPPIESLEQFEGRVAADFTLQPNLSASSNSATTVLKTAAKFCAEYEPLSYAIDGVVRSRSLYTLTARTGAGKTAFMVAAALAVATGRGDILGAEVAQGRVTYLAFENPDDVRMRLMIASYVLCVDLDELGTNLLVRDVREKPEDILGRLKEDAVRHGAFTLILADTAAAWFDGNDINDNVQAGEFMRRVRSLTALPGFPSVIVAAHPVKNAGEEQLVPYGGGAILNEVDGNLTLWKQPEVGLVSLHWQGKLRGLEFSPLPFRFEISGSPDIVDAKGRQVHLPTLRPSTAQAVEDRRQTEADVSRALLGAMLTRPAATLAQWGVAVGRAKGNVYQRLRKLEHDGLVEKTLDIWALTPKGKRLASQKPDF